MTVEQLLTNNNHILCTYRVQEGTVELQEHEFEFAPLEDQMSVMFKVALESNVILGAIISRDERIVQAWDTYATDLEASINKMSEEDAEGKELADKVDMAFGAVAKQVLELDTTGFHVSKHTINWSKFNEMQDNTMKAVEEDLKKMKKDNVETIEVEIVGIEETIKEMTTGLSKEQLKEIFTGDDSEAYTKLLEANQIIIEQCIEFAGRMRSEKVIAKFEAQKKKVNEFLEKHEKTGKALKLVNSIVKKVLAAILGIATFVADTALIIAGFGIRVGIHAVEEGVSAGKAIGGSFKKNIFGLFSKK